MGKIKLNKRSSLTFKKLNKLYQKVKQETNNFKEFKQELIIKNPESVRLFRIMIGKGLVEFSRLLNKSASTIQSLEEKRWNIRIQTAKKYIDIIKNLNKKYIFSSIPYETIKYNYENFYTSRFFSRISKRVPYEKRVRKGKIGGKATLKKYGRNYFVNLAKKGASLGGIAVSKKYPHEHYQKIGKMTGEIHGREKLSEWGKRGGITTASKQKLTEQEELIKKRLDKNKIKNITHHKVEGHNKYYVVDFLVKHNNLDIYIEATAVHGKKSSSYPYSKSLDLIKRIQSIRLKNNKCKFLCIISSKFSVEGMIKLSQYADCVLLDNHLNKLPFIINKINHKTYLKNITKIGLNSILKRKIMFKNGGIATKDLNINKSETKVINFLNRNKIKFSTQSILESKFGTISIVDFILTSTRDLKLIIEVTSINGKSKKALPRTINKMESRLSMLKEFYIKEANLVGLIDNVSQKEINKYNPKFKLISMNNFISNIKNIYSN
ncbi:hypothetical protein J4442_00925 [Candidatus Woesearchaeota archaeon]|nr:hypothetical protein [Candidatus Woesearchaeota archaeon]